MFHSSRARLLFKSCSIVCRQFVEQLEYKFFRLFSELLVFSRQGFGIGQHSSASLDKGRLYSRYCLTEDNNSCYIIVSDSNGSLVPSRGYTWEEMWRRELGSYYLPYLGQETKTGAGGEKRTGAGDIQTDKERRHRQAAERQQTLR